MIRVFNGICVCGCVCVSTGLGSHCDAAGPMLFLSPLLECSVLYCVLLFVGIRVRWQRQCLPVPVLAMFRDVPKS